MDGSRGLGYWNPGSNGKGMVAMGPMRAGGSCFGDGGQTISLRTGVVGWGGGGGEETSSGDPTARKRRKPRKK